MPGMTVARGLLGPQLADELARIRGHGYALDVQAARLGLARMQRTAGHAMRGLFELLKL